MWTGGRAIQDRWFRIRPTTLLPRHEDLLAVLAVSVIPMEPVGASSRRLRLTLDHQVLRAEESGHRDRNLCQPEVSSIPERQNALNVYGNHEEARHFEHFKFSSVEKQISVTVKGNADYHEM